MAIQTASRGWTVQDANGSFDSLTWHDSLPIKQLEKGDVLVKFEAASINYRDLAIAKGFYIFGARDGATPGSDGAGVVVAAGKNASRFREGDEVIPLMIQGYFSGTLTDSMAVFSLGGPIDGTLREYGVFNEESLVRVPKNLSLSQACTLPCAALTAWNALYGARRLVAGDYVLTQGTGGVAMFALQFARAAGAVVIATTSTDEKCEVLKKHGATHVINYSKNPSWGQMAKDLTPEGKGVDFVIEVGGATTMLQSLQSIGRDGTIAVVGYLGGASEHEPTLSNALTYQCNIRGIVVGNRVLFEEMARAIEANDIQPVVDTRIFKLKQAKEAYEYMWGKKHVGKIVITMD